MVCLSFTKEHTAQAALRCACRVCWLGFVTVDGSKMSKFNHFGKGTYPWAKSSKMSKFRHFGKGTPWQNHPKCPNSDILARVPLEKKACFSKQKKWKSSPEAVGGLVSGLS